MKARLSRTAVGALFGALAILCAAPPARAHELSTATARITVRDDHVDVLAEVDVVAYVVRTSGVGSAADIAAAPDVEVAKMVNTARESLESEAHLESDGAQVALDVTDFPSPVEVRALAEWRSAAPRAHGELRPVHLEGARSIPGAKRIALTLPRAMGPVLVTFVQPATTLAEPGSTTAFSVLARPKDEPPQASTLLPRLPLGAIAVALAIAALLSNLALRRGAVDRKAARES